MRNRSAYSHDFDTSYIEPHLYLTLLELQALFSHDGITELLQGPALDNMWIIVRNIKGGPPSCECKNCYRPPPPPPPAPESDADKAGGAGGAGGTGVGTEAGAGGAAGAGAPLPPRVMIDEWMDIRAGDPWPERKLMKALNKTLDTIPGENPDQYVALWYQQGEPIMGRVWNDNGKVRIWSFAMKDSETLFL